VHVCKFLYIILCDIFILDFVCLCMYVCRRVEQCYVCICVFESSRKVSAFCTGRYNFESRLDY